MGLFLAFASLIAAVVPMFFYLLIIWYMDRYEREPFWFVLMNFFWGATGAVFLAIIGSLIFQIPLNELIQAVSDDNPAELMNLSGAVITAPLVEEFTKGLFLLIISFSKRFDGGVDGAVLGGAIGLGFGMTENFMYFLFYGTTPVAWLMIVIIRTLFSAVMHFLATATFGAFLGYAKFKPFILKFILIPTGFFLAVFLHFSWNLSVSFEDTTLFGFLFLILYLFVTFSIFQISVYFEGKTILKELQDEANRGFIPPEHLNHLPYVMRRFKYGWCPAGVDQKSYVKTATTLALRKNQHKNVSGIKKQNYQKDIDNLRYQIQMMFYNAGMHYHPANKI
ncbi:MAG TPA: PrsW family intramembrane metalloprotease [Ignavibacteria bacterium]|nr:PrsW family intramembrane metalloprotease [Ignavibacteria bacterium]HRJ99512.1 PrsW family intramembrane metalloprotease [Ignavibacteria bacterium]HRK00100.1 PrsW family intramembrane metalloprotease [Ignavibacteria bacterium]